MIDKYKPDEVVMDIRAANYRGLDIMKDASKERNDLPFELCTAPSRDLWKLILSCEKPEIWSSEKKTAQIESDRENEAGHSFAA